MADLARPIIPGVAGSRAILWICRCHLALALSTALLAGTLSALMRWQVGLERPGQSRIMPPEWYGQFFTLHGTGMFFFVLLPALLGGFVPLLLGLHRRSPGRVVGSLMMGGFVLHALGWLLLALSPLGSAGGPAAGWSFHPPLSNARWTPGAGMDLFITSLIMWGWGAICTAAGCVVSVLTAANGGLSEMIRLRGSSARFGAFAAQMAVLFAVPSLIVAGGLLLASRIYGTDLYGGPDTQAVLHQHLFWFFAHPAVYMLILPVLGAVTDELLPAAWQEGVWGRLANGCLAMIAVLGFGAWGHHMFQTGLDPGVAGGFSVATFLIAWPSGLLVGLWLIGAPASAVAKPPSERHAHALSFLLTFCLGGVGGLMLASAPMNSALHETYWVVGHIHLVLFGGTVLGLVMMLFQWSEALFGRGMDWRLARAHLWASLPLLVGVFGLMHVMGYMGLGRRLYEIPGDLVPGGLDEINRATSLLALALVTVQGMLVAALCLALGRLGTGGAALLCLLIAGVAGGFVVWAMGSVWSGVAGWRGVIVWSLISGVVLGLALSSKIAVRIVRGG